MEEPQIKHNAIAKAIRKFNPDFILFSGDMVYYNEFDKFGEVITSNYTGDKKIPPYNGIVKKTGAADKPGEHPRYSFLKEADGLKIKFIDLNSSLPDDEEHLQWFLVGNQYKVIGLRCDITRGLPDDRTFESLFIKDRLAVIDEFTLNWQKQCN
ncbi:MAG: hypothetical protein NG747_12055 [Candidatus Brocadia sp.]|nr:hypothetical protein [Candidatus Brocadia sp.]